MSEELLLAIDAGTGSCRAGLFTLDGRQIAIAQREYTHAELPNTPGSQAFDTDVNWELISSCVREVLAGVDASAVAAVSATSMREGMVLYDAAGREIWACPNADGRAGAEIAEMVASGEAKEIFARAGDWVAITAPARLRWIARHQPEVWSAIAHVTMLGDWVLYRLSGEFVTDPSLGSSSGMFDLRRRDWSDHILALCGLDRRVCPPVTEPGTPIGGVSPQAAAQTGLPPGTPVVVGGADTQLSLVGLGVDAPGRITIVGGSFWQTTAVMDQALIDPAGRLRTLCHATPDRWMIEGIGFYCGLVMRWFRDAFCELEIAAAAQTGEDVYDLLERKAASIPPGSHGIVGIFSNVMQADRWVHASPGFVGFDIGAPARSGRLECFRAIEESAAHVARAHVEIIGELLGHAAPTVMLTGGAAKGRLWPQIVADTLGLPVKTPRVSETTALGAAICAGVGVGLYPDASAAARQIVTVDRVYDPDPAAAAAYTQLHHEWRELYAASLQITEAGLARPLWRAAGA